MTTALERLVIERSSLRTQARERIDRLWAAFGCAYNPDSFKASHQDSMLDRMISWARESQVADRRLVRERDDALDKLRDIQDLADSPDFRIAGGLVKVSSLRALLGASS